MIFSRPRFSSQLHDENTFYNDFLQDLRDSEREIIIESPYLTSSRMEKLYAVFEELVMRGVKIVFITRDPAEHEDEYMRHQSTNEILRSKELGIKIVLLKGFHHRKVAIIDRNILWEGSLNILSYSLSLEVMRRIEGKQFAGEMFEFLKLNNFI